jgi:cytochrome c
VYYRANGKKSFFTFSTVGKFQDGDLYVYVIDRNGVMQASGGPSFSLIGRDVSSLKDADGKLIYADIIDRAKGQESGEVEYRWLNWEHGKIERKHAYFRQDGDVAIVVGYYIPRAMPQAAKAMLTRAVEAVERDPKAAIVRFDDINGGFIEDDLYVFVVGLNDGIMYAHGANPRLVGQNARDLKDVNGKPIIRELIDLGKSKGHGELKYTWKNPVTGKQEHKTSFFQRVGGYLVAVGSYTR